MEDHRFNRDFKLRVIDHAKKYGVRTASSDMSVPSDTIDEWLFEERDLRASPATSRASPGVTSIRPAVAAAAGRRSTPATPAGASTLPANYLSPAVTNAAANVLASPQTPSLAASLLSPAVSAAAARYLPPSVSNVAANVLASRQASDWLSPLASALPANVHTPLNAALRLRRSLTQSPASRSGSTPSPQDAARREALLKLQEKYRRDAEEKARKDQEKEEQKRRERLEELERLEQARFGGGSGRRLGSANQSLRQEYNPLMGNGSTCSRPVGGRKQARGG